MDSAADLRSRTSKYFDSINFTELNDRWIEEVIDNEFTDSEENDIDINILFVNDPEHTLNKVSEICLAWSQKSIENESVNTSNANESAREEVLWTILNELDIEVKHIQGVIYLLCSRALKDTNFEDDSTLILGLACAKFYFNCMRVPGSGAYSVYHPNLFQLCINCMPAPDFTSDNHAEYTRLFGELNAAYVSALMSLIPLLKDFHLGDDSSTIELTIKKLVEITTFEIHVLIDFSRNFSNLGIKELTRRSSKPSLNISALAYQALSTIIDTDLNGDKDQNYSVILSHLSKSILCNKARKSQNVSQKHLLVKDNAVNFVIYNLKNKEFFSEVTQIAVKRLCLSVCDKTEIRNAVSSSIITMLFNFKDEHAFEMVQWFLLLVDSADTKDRVFALDILGHFLSFTNQEEGNSLPDSFKKDSFNASVIFAILTRCDDVSPNVRTKALTVLSNNMNCVLNFLDKTKDFSTFETEDSEEESVDRDVEVNGNHRYFWYNLTSFRDRLDEIAAILQRRIEDNNVTARKAALVALENLMAFDLTYVNEVNLKLFELAGKDSTIVVRKQMILSLTVILEAHCNVSEVQEAWLKCVLPLLHDPENSVLQAAALVLEKQVLQKTLSSDEASKESAFALLKLLSSDEFVAHQRFLQKAFSLWKNENKLKPQSIAQLDKYVGTEWEDCVWFFISFFASYCSLPSRVSHCCVEQFEKYSAGECPIFMQYILKILLKIYKNLPAENLEKVHSIICECLKSYSIPVELIDLYIKILYKIHNHWETESEFASFSAVVVKKCEEHLAGIKSRESFADRPSVELLAKYFCTIKEFCQLCHTNITPSLVSLLKAFSAFEEVPKAFLRILTPGLRAHVLAALGKVCLQDEILAKELIPVFAKELLTSKYDVIRSNIVIILTEMCKRYTSYADKYMPLICFSLKDKVCLIRYQTIILIINLLQEGYIKWKGPLFFCLLSCLVDKEEIIQELGRYSLTKLIEDKRERIFLAQFADCIFVLNSFSPPENETVCHIAKDFERFGFSGESNREKRMFLYRFLLEGVQMNNKSHVTKSICDILMNVAETVYPLNKTTECMVRDCFEILNCNEIRVYNADKIEGINEEMEDEMSKTELCVRRLCIVEPVIAIIINLRNSITDSESDLMHDIILFLKELLHDFRDSLSELLAGDKILLGQLGLELKNDAERDRTEKRMEKESKDKKKQHSDDQPEQAACPPITMESIQTMMKDAYGTDGGGRPESPKARSPQGTPKVPSQTSRNVGQCSASTSPGNDTDRPSTSAESSQPVSFNITTDNPTEVNEIHRLASTPRLILKKLPLTTDILNISAVVSEQMDIDEPDNGH